MNGKVALEEHWAVNETLHIPGQPVAAGAFWDETRRLLVDFHYRRLAAMDAHGIEFAILGLNSPALQAVLDPVEAAELARRTNDIRGEALSTGHYVNEEAPGQVLAWFLRFFTA